jgi:hypothetical protein
MKEAGSIGRVLETHFFLAGGLLGEDTVQRISVEQRMIQIGTVRRQIRFLASSPQEIHDRPTSKTGLDWERITKASDIVEEMLGSPTQ